MDKGKRGKGKLVRQGKAALAFCLVPLLFASCPGDGEVSSPEVDVQVAAAETAPKVTGGASSDPLDIGPPSDLSSQFSYIYGYQMTKALGGTLGEDCVAYIVIGARDYLLSDPLYTEDEMDQILADYQAMAYQHAQERIEELRASNLEEAEAFLASNARRSGVVSISDQVQYEVLREGSGASPGRGSTVTVEYELVTLAGEVKDSSYGRDGGMVVDLDDTIPGFSAVLLEMKEGGKVRAWVHPDQGYGAYGNGNIGPNQLLIFDIELLSVSAE